MWSFSRPFLFALVCAVTHPVFAAEPTQAEVEAAKNNYSQAIELRDKGDRERALGFFRSAYALVPTPITALEVGRTELQLGRAMDAKATLRAAAAMPEKQGESTKAKEARAEARELADKIDAKLAHLTIAWDKETPVGVTIDGQSVPPESGARDLEPGHHVIMARGGGKMGNADVDLKEGEDRKITIALDADDDRVPVKRRFEASRWIWIGAGGGAVGLAVGSAFGIAAVVTASNVDKQCPNHVCPPSAQGDVSASQAAGWVSTIGFIVAGVGAVIMVVGLAASRIKEPPKSALTFGLDGISGRF